MTKNNVRFTTITTTIALTALMLIIPLTIATPNTTTPQAAFASGATGTNDPNGLLRLDPVAGYSFSIGNEYYIDSAIKNFRSDGSERIDWKSKNIGDDGFIIAGYVDVVKGSGNNSNWCTENAGNPGEEISTKVNGGPHTDNNANAVSTYTDITPWPSPNSADTMDVGNINAAGTQGRLRAEVTHPDYTTIAQYDAAGNTYPNTDICHASPDNKIGFYTVKLNLDSNCDGVYDKIYLVSFIDTSGFDANGKPRNKWTIAQGGYRTSLSIFTPASVPLKSVFEYWGRDPSVNHPTDSYTTLRIDHQSQAAWQNNANPPYYDVTLKEITNVHKDTCPTVNAIDPGATHPGTDDSGLAAPATAATTPTSAESTSTTTTVEEEDGLAQSDDPQSEDNNDNTADDSGNNNNNNNKEKVKDEDKEDNDNNNNKEKSNSNDD